MQLTLREGEKLLLTAVLIRAVRDYVVYSKRSSPEDKQIAESARKWIFEETDEDSYVASFQNICLAMDLDCSRVRDTVLKMLPKDAKRLAYGALTAEG